MRSAGHIYTVAAIVLGLAGCSRHTANRRPVSGQSDMSELNRVFCPPGGKGAVRKQMALAETARSFWRSRTPEPKELPAGSYYVCARPGQVSANGLCWPVIGRVSRGFASSRNHKGLDICAPEGTPVMAAQPGRVIYAGNKLSGYGNVVVLDHGNGVASIYGHNSANLVQSGDVIRRGQFIALVGQTGNATTPHCHFELRRNACPFDPRPLLP